MRRLGRLLPLLAAMLLLALAAHAQHNPAPPHAGETAPEVTSQSVEDDAAHDAAPPPPEQRAQEGFQTVAVDDGDAGAAAAAADEENGGEGVSTVSQEEPVPQPPPRPVSAAATSPADATFEAALAASPASLERLQLLQEAAAAGHPRAQTALGFTLLLGNSTDAGQNFTRSFELFTAAAKTGLPDAQWGLGFLFATGLGTNSSQAKALVYMTFAALGNSMEARMALGYRYHLGNGVPQACEQALMYYRPVADRVSADVELSGGETITRKRIGHEQPPSQKRSQMTEEDIAHYYQNNADRGDVEAQSVIGQFFYHGSHGLAQDYAQAHIYLEQAALQGDAEAMAHLGEMYNEGHHVDANHHTALEWFQRAASLNSHTGHNGLGLMYLHGHGVPVNKEEALKHFSKAAADGNPNGHFNLGTMYYNGWGTKRDMRKALDCFKLASQHGHVLAMASLANMHATGAGAPRNCEIATSLMKNVAERGSWATRLEEAYELFETGEVERSLVLYLLLAEMGFEVAQHNAAHILDEGELELFDREGTFKRALVNWKRSALQGQSDSRVKIGDYYFYGLGTEVDLNAAASEYRSAIDARNAQAMFNLGWMYEQGMGLPRDLHLAKRYYDMAADVSAEAAMPATLALLHLRVKSFFEWLASDGLEAADRAISFDFSLEDVDAFLVAYERHLLSTLGGLFVLVLLAYHRRYTRTRPRAA